MNKACLDFNIAQNDRRHFFLMKSVTKLRVIKYVEFQQGKKEQDPTETVILVSCLLKYPISMNATENKIVRTV